MVVRGEGGRGCMYMYVCVCVRLCVYLGVDRKISLCQSI